MSYSDKKFYVYLHVDPTTKAPFYVGCGTNTRAHDKSGHNKEWQDYYDKLQEQGLVYEVHILHTCSSQKEAEDLERIEIYLRSRSGQKLVNICHNNPDKTLEEMIEEDSIPMFMRIKRKALGYTQETMAERIGVSQRFYKELERGKKTCRMDKVFQVIGHLGGKISVKQ